MLGIRPWSLKTEMSYKNYSVDRLNRSIRLSRLNRLKQLKRPYLLNRIQRLNRPNILNRPNRLNIYIKKMQFLRP